MRQHAWPFSSVLLQQWWSKISQRATLLHHAQRSSRNLNVTCWLSPNKTWQQLVESTGIRELHTEGQHKAVGRQGGGAACQHGGKAASVEVSVGGYLTAEHDCTMNHATSRFASSLAFVLLFFLWLLVFSVIQLLKLRHGLQVTSYIVYWYVWWFIIICRLYKSCRAIRV